MPIRPRFAPGDQETLRSAPRTPAAVTNPNRPLPTQRRMPLPKENMLPQLPRPTEPAVTDPNPFNQPRPRLERLRQKRLEELPEQTTADSDPMRPRPVRPKFELPVQLPPLIPDQGMIESGPSIVEPADDQLPKRMSPPVPVNEQPGSPATTPRVEARRKPYEFAPGELPKQMRPIIADVETPSYGGPAPIRINTAPPANPSPTINPKQIVRSPRDPNRPMPIRPKFEPPRSQGPKVTQSTLPTQTTLPTQAPLPTQTPPSQPPRPAMIRPKFETTYYSSGRRAVAIARAQANPDRPLPIRPKAAESSVSKGSGIPSSGPAGFELPENLAADLKQSKTVSPGQQHSGFDLPTSNSLSAATPSPSPPEQPQSTPTGEYPQPTPAEVAVADSTPTPATAPQSNPFYAQRPGFELPSGPIPKFEPINTGLSEPNLESPGRSRLALPEELLSMFPPMDIGLSNPHPLQPVRPGSPLPPMNLAQQDPTKRLIPGTTKPGPSTAKIPPAFKPDRTPFAAAKPEQKYQPLRNPGPEEKIARATPKRLPVAIYSRPQYAQPERLPTHIERAPQKPQRLPFALLARPQSPKPTALPEVESGIEPVKPERLPDVDPELDEPAWKEESPLPDAPTRLPEIDSERRPSKPRRLPDASGTANDKKPERLPTTDLTDSKPTILPEVTATEESIDEPQLLPSPEVEVVAPAKIVDAVPQEPSSDYDLGPYTTPPPLSPDGHIPFESRARLVDVAESSPPVASSPPPPPPPAPVMEEIPLGTERAIETAAPKITYQHPERIAAAPTGPRYLGSQPSHPAYFYADFSAIPVESGSLEHDAAQEQWAYDYKRDVPTQRPCIEWGREFYGSGIAPPGINLFGPTNMVRPKFYVYGDYRAGIATGRNAVQRTDNFAQRLNLDFDLQITDDDRLHAFVGPLDKGAQTSRWEVVDGDLSYQSEWDLNPATAFYEGDLGVLLGSFHNVTSPFELPITVGLIPLLFQNGIWMEDAVTGAAFAIPARHSRLLKWANYDATFFAAFDRLNSPAFGASDHAAQAFGTAWFIDAYDGYIEAGYAFVRDRNQSERSYHNFTVSFTRRYFDRISNSWRLIFNTGQDLPDDSKTADGLLLLVENSWITRYPLRVVPYANFFAGWERPQSVARAGVSGGILRNTGINFDPDGLNGLATLDATAANTVGGSVGIDLLGRHLERQLILEATYLTPHNGGSPTVPGDQVAMGTRFQMPLSNHTLLRMDARYGWRRGLEDVYGTRIEYRWKF